MAVILESSSPNEILLRDALVNEGMSFKEQYPIYDGGKFSQPKYFVDFLITHNGKKLIVECDGYTYHISNRDVDQNIYRDNWIKNKTGIKIARFTSYQLKRELPKVIAVIKKELGVENIPKSKLKFKGRDRRKSYIINVNDANLHEVTLYYDYIQFKDTVWLTYRFEDLTLSKFSDIRMRAFYNVPEKVGRELALMVALLDLKRSTKILIFCQSEWLTSYLNREMRFKAKDGILNKVDDILCKHNYLMRYINTKRNSMYYDKPINEYMIFSEIHSKCKQIRYERLESFTKDSYENFEAFANGYGIKFNEK